MQHMQTKGFKGNYQSPVTFFTLPLASAVAREVSRVQVAAAGGQAEDLVWDPQLRAFPHPQVCWSVCMGRHGALHSSDYPY